MPLLAIIWHQLNEKISAHKKACDQAMQDHKEANDREFDKLWTQIGKDSNSGMRVHVHDIVNVKGNIVSLHERVSRLEARKP